MTKIDNIILKMKNNPNGISFNDLSKVCDQFFGKPRKSSGSHRVYKIPWQGDPKINIQNDKGKAKAYQVKQVLLALERLEANYGVKK